MKKYVFLLVLFIVVCGVGTLKLVKAVFYVPLEIEQKTEVVIEKFKDEHKIKELEDGVISNPFGDDDLVNILLIGLDSRVGETIGHCDAIQLITIDRKNKSVKITAVPRGTYSPLPPGKGSTSSDYYVSNACGLGGLDYGIKQIEKILGQKADYLVVVGFSEALGVLRNLNLPAISTLRWLRQRQIYAIGEPQRARDHSEFLKYLLINHVPLEPTRADTIWQYVIYKTVQTTLSFADVKALFSELSLMDLPNNQNRIQLAMRPSYAVQNIEYSPENIDEFLNKKLETVKKYLSTDDYSDASVDEIQEKLMFVIEEKKDDPDFIIWAFNNNVWLQIEDKEKRLSVQFDFIKKYTQTINNEEERNNLISDYILEMNQLGEFERAMQGEDLR